jgi:hypothetical protein
MGDADLKYVRRELEAAAPDYAMVHHASDPEIDTSDPRPLVWAGSAELCVAPDDVDATTGGA